MKGKKENHLHKRLCSNMSLCSIFICIFNRFIFVFISHSCTFILICKSLWKKASAKLINVKCYQCILIQLFDIKYYIRVFFVCEWDIKTTVALIYTQSAVHTNSWKSYLHKGLLRRQIYDVPCALNLFLNLWRQRARLDEMTAQFGTALHPHYIAEKQTIIMNVFSA